MDSFEHKQQRLLPLPMFIRRVLLFAGVTAVLIGGSWGIGIIGYRVLENMSWIDATLNAAMILGGMGRTAGVIAAAILLTVLPELLRDFAEYRMIVYALLIIFMMLLRPGGLFSINFKRRSSAA